MSNPDSALHYAMMRLLEDGWSAYKAYLAGAALTTGQIGSFEAKQLAAPDNGWFWLGR